MFNGADESGVAGAERMSVPVVCEVLERQSQGVKVEAR